MLNAWNMGAKAFVAFIFLRCALNIRGISCPLVSSYAMLVSLTTRDFPFVAAVRARKCFYSDFSVVFTGRFPEGTACLQQE